MNSQQAINLLNGLEQRLDDYCELNNEGKAAFRMAITALELFGNAEQLPSAQPQHNVRFSDADHVWIDGKQYISLQRFGKAIKDAQPETIRCKDCEWWTKQKDSLQGRCALMQMYPTGGWFCANARRKER